MARFSRGRRALAISDRSGAAFPYKEMVKEWTGAWVHISEFEPKQPQLQPHPVGADPQALQHARPARTEFPVEDILPNDPFTTTAASGTLSVSFPNNGFNEGTTHVRFREVKVPVGGVAVSTLELETTLNGNINNSVDTITLTDATEFPTSGFIVIEKMNSETGAFENETPERFDEHLEPQVAFMYDFTFTHIFKFENMLDEALQFPYFATGEGVIRAHLNPARAQRSQYLDLAHIQNENQELLDMIVAKYYSRDYEIWLNPDKFINKPVR